MFKTGKLDCLRESLPLSPNETKDQKELRLAANWDSDCSFESEEEGGINFFNFR
jgi:hypothetical protein